TARTAAGPTALTDSRSLDGGTVPAVASASTVEADFLCLIARPRPDWSAAASLIRAGLDFGAVLRLAEQHSVRPQLLKAFGYFAWDGVPAAVRAECDGFQR